MATAVGSVFGAPLGSSNYGGEVLVEGRPEPRPGDETSATLRSSTHGYLETIRIPVLRGRGLEPSDGQGALPVAVVSERFEEIETMEEVVRRELASGRFYLTLVGIFAGLAVVLAAVGLYGVVAYLVSRRTREIGVRMAMGAGRNSIARLVLGQGMLPAAAGIAVGLLVAYVGSRVLESLLYEVDPTDPAVFAAVPWS